MNYYKKCCTCGSILPITQFHRKWRCIMCSRLRGYRNEFMRWCHRCKIWYERCNIKHQHTNTFAKSIFDFKGAHYQKDNYFRIVHTFVNEVHHNHLRSSRGYPNNSSNSRCIICSHNLTLITFSDLLPESEINVIKNAGILTPASLLINIEYFKYERIRQFYSHGT